MPDLVHAVALPARRAVIKMTSNRETRKMTVTDMAEP
jgi:hypothetical protein